ncbi:MAG: DUF2924 domain-containing protein [Pirellulales bacterium]|nr:DUF2924 domain-containing protein [Pirellulales bacterium]
MTLDIEVEQDRLQRLTVTQLKTRYEELFQEPARSGNRVWLCKRVLWRLQANVFGDLSDRARRRALEIADDRELRMKAPRTMPLASAARVLEPPRPERVREPDDDLRPGTVLRRIYKGRPIHVQVHDEGFEWDGQRYASLTAVARAVTGSHWNGRRFFGLTRGKAAR